MQQQNEDDLGYYCADFSSVVSGISSINNSVSNFRDFPSWRNDSNNFYDGHPILFENDVFW